jgi:hypothetical protein
VTVASTLIGAAYGTISFVPQGSATLTGNGTATVVVRGSTADVQATLNQMTYTPADPNLDATVLVSVTVNDLDNGAEGVGVTGNNTRSGSFNIHSSNVNEAPVLTVPPTLTVNEDSSNNAVAGISFIDSDDFGLVEKITLDLGGSPKGTISLASIAGLSFSTGDGTTDTKMVFTGTKAAINAALSTLRFTPTANINTVGGGNEQVLTVTVDDQGNTGTGGAKSDSETVLITISPVNDAPRRTAATTTLTAVLEDTANPPGNTVSSLFTPVFSDTTDTQTGGSTANGLAGVAIVTNAATPAQGKWQYDSGGGWTDLPTLSLTSSFLLKTTDALRFLPTANWNGTPGQLSVRLIDDSAGGVTSGSRPNLTGGATGGTTVYANLANAVGLSTAVTAVNDAPVASGTATLAAVDEDTGNPPGTAVSALITGANYSDATDTVAAGSSATALGGMAIVGNAVNPATQGAWEYSTDGGGSWTVVPAGLADGSALILPTTAQLRFVPVAEYHGTPGSLSVRLADSPQVLNASADITAQLGGTNTWSAATIPITTVVRPVNDVPTISDAGSTRDYLENAAAVTLEPLLSLADIDDTQLDRAVISISAGFVAGDRLNFSDQLGISGTFTPGTGILTLTGTASRDDYRTALRSIGFDSSSDNPGAGTRTISWSVRDVNSEAAANGQQTSLVATTTVNVTPVNDAPGFSGLDATSLNPYTENGAAIQIDNNVQLTDPELDGANWDRATLTLQRLGGANAEDLFSGTGALTLAGGGQVILSGTTVGTFTQAAGTLAITFNVAATPATADAVIRALGYSNTSEDPPASVTLAYTVNDRNSNITGGGTDGGGRDQGNGGQLAGSGSIVVNINPVNDLPVNTLPLAQSTLEDTPLVITGLAVADVDNASLSTTLSLPAGSGTLTVTGGSGATVTGDGSGTVTIAGTTAQINAALASLTYTPTADFNTGAGSLDLTIATTDGVLTDTDTLAIAVTPVADIVADTVITDEDTPISFNAITGSHGASADNFENAGRVVSAVTQGAHGSVAFAADGTLTYTPDADYHGSDSFTYTVTSGGVEETTTVDVTVNPVNDLPVNTLPLAQSTLEDTPLVITGLAVADVDNASLSTTLSLPAGSGTLTVTGGSGATVTGDGSGTVTIAGTTAQINAALASLTYTPTADFNTGAGSLDLTIATTDGVLTDTDTLAIAVTPVADIVADTVITDEDTPISFNAITGSHGASADNFENAGRVVSAVTQGAHGSVAFAADGTLTYTPDADYHGPDSFTYTVTSGGVEETTTVDVTVNPVNDLPVNTLPLAQSTLEDTPLVITGLAVADVDNASLSTTLSLPAGSGTLTVTGGSGATVTGDGSGTVTIAGTTAQINAALASLTYTPTADFNTGAGSLDLTIATTDGVLTDTDTLAIAVTPVADIVADTVITDEDTPISFNAITGSHGASADNFENAGRVVSAVTQGAHGSVAFAADGTLTYTPDADYHGSDSFTYTVTSGGVEETTTVDVTVNPVNDLPVNTLPLAQSTLEDTPLVITGLAVADVDNASLSTTLSLPAGSGTLTVTGGSGATVTGDGSGTVTIAGTTAQINAALASLTYTPTADFNTGAGSLDLTIATTDGVLTDTDTLAIAVTPVADIVADTVITDEDTPISFNAITGSHGASADNFENAGRVVSAVTQGAHGSVAFAADGTLTYTPDADYHGSDSFTYTVTSGGVEETTTVDVTVNPVNDLPVNTLPLAQSTLEDTPLVITGLAVADVDNASLSTTLSLPAGSGTLTVTGGSGATVTGDGSGTVTIAGTTAQINAALASLTYTPTADFNTGAGSLDLTIATTDGVLTDTDTLAIAVTPVADIVADTVITDEDTPISFNAITGSHGASADNFENAGRVVSAVTQGAHGSVAFAADGTLTYTPDADYHGSDSFTYTVTSGGVEETTTVDVTVNPVNDLPVNTLPLAQSTLEDTPLVITGLAVADVDNASLSTTLSLPAGSGTLTVTGGSGATVTGDGSGTVTIAGTTAQINAALASLTYTPTADFNTGAGSLDLTIATTDGVLTDTDTLAIAVTPVADIVADTVITDEDTPISFNAITGSHGASADNFENAGRVVSAVTQGAHGSVAFAADGTLTYTPDADYHGPDSFTYTVTSGGVEETTTVDVTVNPVNDLPVNTLPLAQSTLEDTPLVITGLAVADVDNASLSTTLSLPAGSGTLTVTGGSGATVTGDGSGTVTIAGTTAQINAALASLTYTPTADFNTGAGSLDLTIATTDGVLTDTDTLAIAVTPVADIVADTVITDEDTPISFNAITGSHGASADNFENAGRVVSAVTQGAHGSVAFAADGTLTYTPDADYHGPDSFTYTVTSGGVEETTTVDVTVNPVNDLPVNTLPLAQSTLEDTPLVITGLAVADVDNASLSTTLSLPAGSGTLTVTGGSGATVTGDGSGTVTIAGTTAQINAALASLTYTPTADFNTGAGSLDLTIATTDGVLTDTDTLAIAVTPVADIVADTVITDEDTPISFNAITGSHGASADNFENAGRVVSAVTQGAHGSVAFAADGTLTYTPDADYHGSDSFTYTVTSGGVEETTTVDVTVNPVNDLPVNTLPLAQSTLEDTPLVITGLAVADVDNASLSTTLSLPAGSGTLTVTGGSGATVTGDGSGTVTIAGTTAQINAALASLTYTPTADFNTGAGSLDLTIATTDGVLTDTDTLAIAVTPVADIVADTVITDEDTPISFNAITGSHGASADNFENAGRVVSAVTQGAHGSVAFAADGTLTYTPDADYHGPDSFTYTVTSGGVEETTTVDVTVNPVNDLPVNTLPLAQSTLEDTPLVITGLAVADVDNASLSTTLSLPAGSGTLTVTGGSGATVTGDGSGTVTIAGTTAQINAALASLTYTPTADFNTGAGSLDLTIATTDGVLTDTDTLAIAVTPVADIVADTVITDEDTPISFNAITGSHGASADNFENAGRVVSAVTQGAHGSVAFAADGTLTYTPDADYHGPDSFTYTVTSGGVEETTTVDVTVNPIDDLPVAVDDTFLTDEDSALTGQTLAPNDTPSGDGGNTWALATGPSHGSVVVNADGSFTYTPDADYHGPDSFTYTLTDADGDVSTATALLTVNPIDDLPVAVDDTFLTDEDSALTGQTLAPNDTPSGDGGNTWALATGPSHGSVVVNADGSFTYTPDADYHGPDSFTYTLTDADGDVSTATALLTVNPIDDLPVAVDDTFLTDEDSALTGQTLAPNDTPSGDGGNTWALATGPSHGSVVVNADGSFTYTPDADYHGPDSFTYTLTDADGDVSTATALLTVNPIDDLPVAVDDTFLTDEDSALTGQTLAPNDTPSGDGGNTWALATGPSHGSVVVNADGSFTYTPDADYHGPDSFTYTLTDADGDVSTATALLTVNPIDDLPVAVDDTFLTDEDSALTGQTLAPNDTPSGDGGNTWALATGPSHGSVVVNADGSFTYTPDADYHGPDSFTYTLTDADGDVSTATALLTVNPIDDLPVAVDDTFLTDEDSALTGQTLAPNDTPSGDGGNTWALATGPSHGSVVVNADGSFTYTPDADYHGPDSFTYTLTDADGDVSTATALLTVNPIDDLPVAVDDTFLTDEDSALTGQTLAPNDTPSGDGGNTWALATGPSHGSVVVNADGSFTYTPDADYHGPDSFTYTLTDADGDVSTATALLTVNPIDDLPVAVDDTFLTDEDSALTGQTLAPNDTPSGDGGNTWALATGPSHGSVVVNADGSFTYTPDADYHGPDSFTYTLTDADGDVSTATALLTVNPIDDLPVAVDDTFLTDEDSALTQTLAPNDTPSGDGGNTWALATGPSHGSVVVNADGSFTYTPDADYHGPDSFTYTLTDADGDVSTATALLTVNPIDDLPVAVDDTFLTDEDSALTGQTLAPNDTPSGDGGNTWALATGPSHGSVVVNADGSFTYTPDADYHGPDSFTYTLTDADGDVSTATALLTVNPIDDLPVAVDDTFLTDEDSALTGQTLAPNDTPSGDGGNTWALATGPSHGSVVVNADGSFTYTPDADYHGPDSFTYTLTDADGDVSTATALLTVNPIDDLPVAVDDTFLTDEDSALTGQTLAPNDTPSGDGGNTWALATGPSHGSVVVNADGSFTYTPDADYHGPDSFTYTLTDADGDVSTATALLTVNPIDDLPVAVDDTFLTDEDSALTGQTLAPNDTPSGDGGNTWALATGPSHGSVVVNADGSFTYTPDADYHGPDSFTYTLTDADGDVSTATALLTVNPIDDLPVAVDDTFLTDEDSALTGQTLAPNDTPSGDGGNTWALATGPSHGSVVVNADGSFTYTPDADYHGPDSFTYTLTDADGDVSTATALLTVNPIDDLPVAVDDTFLTNEDSALTGQTLAPNDTPSGDGGNTWALATGPSHGSVVVNADGSFTYTPDADYHGPDSFTYTLTDADGDVSTATALLTVNPIDDLPVAVDDTFLTDEDSALTGQTLAPNDTPSGDGGNTWALATGPSHGSVVVNADGSFTYTPDADYHGPDSFTYTLTDADGDVSTATALLTVNPIDDLPVAVDDTFLTNEDSALTGQTLAPNDTPSGDGGNTWTLATGPSHGSVVVNADGSFTYTPDADYHGPDSFTYTLTDADGDVSTATALLTVNPIDDLPVAVDDTFLTDEDSALTGQTLAPNDTPSGDGGNTWALATGPSHGSVVVNADGSFTYTPDADYHGPDSFTYTLTDADGDVSTATALLTVNPIDDLPVAVDDTFLTDEDSALTGQTLAPNDTPSGDGGNTWALATGPSHGSVVVNADGSFTYTPDADYHGTDSFTYTLTDADGDVSTATALLTVNPIDDLPVAVDDTFLTDEDSALTQTLAPNDTPSGDGGNTWALATGPSHGSVVVNARRQLHLHPGRRLPRHRQLHLHPDRCRWRCLHRHRPPDHQPHRRPAGRRRRHLPHRRRQRADRTDPGPQRHPLGGWRQHLDARHRTQPRQRRGQRRRQLHLHPGRRLPRHRQLHLHPDRCRWRCLHRHRPPDRQPHRRPAGRRRRHLPHRRRQRADRTDPGPNDTPSGDGGNTWALATGPSHGTVVVNADGSFTYTPDADYHGPDSFTYTLTDADGDVSTATALLTVNPIDDLPVAVDDTFLTDEDSALTQTLAPNDTPSGDGGNTWALATGPSHGTVVVNADGSFTYTPDADYHGPDSFTYTLTDADGDVSTATALLTVNPIDDLPVAVDDTFLTDEDSALTGQTLAPNDTPSGDGGNTWALATGPSHGSVVVNADGSFTYTRTPTTTAPTASPTP